MLRNVSEMVGTNNQVFIRWWYYILVFIYLLFISIC